jgi:FAD binding domain
MQSTNSIPQLRAAFNGRLITPDDATYDQARTVFYGGFDQRHPALIIRVADATDVARVVELARQTGLKLAVRSGGHSNAGHGVSDGGIVLDLGELRALDLDVAARTAWAETGLTAGEYTTAGSAHGLATGFGDTASVGIGGITLGGGVGYLVRKHGLTIDDLHLDDQDAIDLGKGRHQRAIPFDRTTALALDRYLRLRASHTFAHLPNLWPGARSATSSVSTIATRPRSAASSSSTSSLRAALRLRVT